MGSISFILPCILGAFFFVALCYATPTPTPDLEFERCRNSSESQFEAVNKCIEDLFSEESMNETRRLHSDTKCVKCRNMCRRRDEINHCIEAAAEEAMLLSNRSKIMVPILIQFTRDGLTSFCEIESTLSSVFGDQESSACFQKKRRACISFLNFIREADEAAFCDSSNPKYSAIDAGVLCRGFHGFLECTERGAESCSSDVQSAVRSLVSQFRNLPTCSEFV
ncbi:uncharacterized protein LOC124154358 [Ischnura elegans]|uniref:uncharacterized protein LOC124154358 n=1 Tax=Ischnura elegans TaxID=197161 RepID=UPI001ED87FD7|nr:uncharacterized protein LOC124154358 [Ischnura elegans]